MRYNLLLILSFFLAFSSCKKETTPEPDNTPVNPVVPPDNDHILLGNPTNAQTNAGNGNNYLKDNIYYKISYSSSRGIPVWVSWHLQSSDLGSTQRQDDFRPDVLPAAWYSVTDGSYSNSGFDRGHNVPSADRTSSIPANSSTFLMTNIIPQAPNLNQGPWEGLEDYIRNTLVGTANEAYLVMGNYGNGGRGLSGMASTIDNGMVAVPKNVWKLAVIMPKGNNDLARLDTSAKVLAVNMPNDNALYSTSFAGKSSWKNYIVSITELEQAAASNGLTLNFLGNVDATVRAYLKNKKFQ